MLSNEYITDSDDVESENEVTTSTKTNSKKKSQATPSDQRNGTRNGAKPSQKPSKSRDDNSDDSDDSTTEDDSSEASNNSDDDEESETSVVESSTSKKRQSSDFPTNAEPVPKKARVPDSSRKIAPKPFKAPSGFESSKSIGSSDMSATTDLFSNLNGQQVWHISAPESLDIKSIKSLDLQAALRGEGILTKDGLSYNMLATPIRDEILLLPKSTNGVYEASQIKISRSFHLREMTNDGAAKKADSISEEISIPAISSLEFTAQNSGRKKPPRKQPPGLKMRYLPYGAARIPSTGTESADIEMQDQFVVPKEVDDDNSSATNKKKHKKSRDRDHNVETGLDLMEVDIDTPQKKAKTSSKSHKPAQAAVSTGEDETPREKKKKKKLRDEAVL